MRFPLLWHRRVITVPTIWGWAIILIVAVAAGIFSARQVYSFLAIERPSGARILVVEGWMSTEDFDQAVSLIQSGNYREILTTGGPVPATLTVQTPISYAVLAREYLIRRGISSGLIAAIPSPDTARDRTYLSAAMVRDYFQQTGTIVDAIDVFSVSVHSRRTRLLYQMAFGSKVTIGVFSAKPRGYDPDHWWQTSAGAKAVIMEIISWIWTELFFNPPERGPQEEKWGAGFSYFTAPAG